MQRKWRVSLIVCVGVFMASLDLFIVNIAFPAIGSALRRRVAELALLGAQRLRDRLRGAARAGGALGGRVRAKARVPARARAVRARERGDAPSPPSIGALVGARVLQAIGGALMLPTSLGLMLPEFGAHERHVAIGMWAATGGIAAAAGPPLGGLLVQADWRLVFLVNIPVGLAGIVAGARTLRERREANAIRPDLLGAVELIVAVAALVGAIVKGEDWGWTSPAILGSFALSLALVPAIWRRCNRHPAPVLEPGDAARAQLPPGGGSFGAVLRGLRRDAPHRRAVPHDGLARERADGRPDAVPRPRDGDRVQHPLGADRRAASASACRACSGRSCSRPARSGTSPTRAASRTTSRTSSPGC